MVDLCSGELSSYVEYGAAEDREDKVILFEEHTPVVGAFPSVVKREDAWGLPQVSWEVGGVCYSTYSIIFMSRIEWNCRSSAFNAALVVSYTVIRESILFGNPGEVTGKLCIGYWVLAVVE